MYRTKVKSENGKKASTFQGAKVFNMIPTDMQDSQSLLFFKSKRKGIDFDFQLYLFLWRVIDYVFAIKKYHFKFLGSRPFIDNSNGIAEEENLWKYAYIIITIIYSSDVLHFLPQKQRLAESWTVDLSRHLLSLSCNLKCYSGKPIVNYLVLERFTFVCLNCIMIKKFQKKETMLESKETSFEVRMEKPWHTRRLRDSFISTNKFEWSQ